MTYTAVTGFGTGVMFMTPLAGGTPIRVGILQDMSVEISFEEKPLYGLNQFPAAIARGKASCKFKAKTAQIDSGAIANLILGGTPQSGEFVMYDLENHTVPASSAYTVQVTNNSGGIDDFGVVYALTGQPLTLVNAGSEATGKYSVNTATGTYTFAAGDASAAIQISYKNQSSSGLHTPVANLPMGTTLYFRVDFYQGNPENVPDQWGMRLYQCMSSKLTLQTKQDDWIIPEFEGICQANQQGQVLDFNTAGGPAGFQFPLIADGIKATVDIDFVGDQSYISGTVSTSTAPLTVSRASAGYIDDASGNWSVVGANVARRSNKGLLVEEARTNSIRNNSMQGASIGTPGVFPNNWGAALVSTSGISFTVVGLGTESGIDYIDIQISGTPVGSGAAIFWHESPTQITASNGQLWTSSAFVKLANGSLANVLSLQLDIQENNGSGSALIGHTTLIVPSSSTALGTQRFTNPATLSQASCAYVQPIILVNVTNGQAINLTLRVGLPQIEQGAVATSPIRTTNAAAARAADVIRLTSAPASPSALTVHSEAMFPVAPPSGSGPILLEFDDGSDANKAQLSTNSSLGHNVQVLAGSAVQWSVGIGGTISVGNVEKYALAIAASNFGSAYNGTVGASQASGSVPTGLNRFFIGTYWSGTFQANAYVRRVTFWPARISSSGLQGITKQ